MGVSEATDCEETIDQLQNNGAIDLVILDSVLPKKGRKSVYDTVMSTRPEIKVLFLSSHMIDIALDQTIRDKGLPNIPKPLLPNELLEKVRELLDA